MKMRHREAAGILVIKRMGESHKLLVLRTHDGKLDVPKGCMEEGETPFETALRETVEEAGIADVEFVWGTESFFVGQTTTMYVARTKSSPVIRPNPVTDVLEHRGYSWVDVTTAPIMFEGHWLEPAICWACEIVDG